jgi:hypothetical protein
MQLDDAKYASMYERKVNHEVTVFGDLRRVFSLDSIVGKTSHVDKLRGKIEAEYPEWISSCGEDPRKKKYVKAIKRWLYSYAGEDFLERVNMFYERYDRKNERGELKKEMARRYLSVLFNGYEGCPSKLEGEECALRSVPEKLIEIMHDFY